MTLKEAYSSIKSYVPENSIESIEILEQIQKYWNYWKPTTTKVLLLAESHVYTSQHDFNVSCNSAILDEFIKGSPLDFIRLIYCLGYGEPKLLTQDIPDNAGTTQFWEIFSSCIARNENDLGLYRTLKGCNSFYSRLRNKVGILSELKRRGIWLIDASIVGIYKGALIDNKIKERVFFDSWDHYITSVVTEAHPKHIIVIGKGVGDTLSSRLGRIKKSIGAECTILSQPQGIRDKVERMTVLKQYQRICSKYAPEQ
jgi:hypothetical protein